MIRAVVFDFDGVVMDTEGPELRAWSTVFFEYGCVLDEREWSRYVGSVELDPYAELQRLATVEVDPEHRVLDRVRADLSRAHQAAPAMPGLLAWLDEARALGLAVGVASNSPLHLIDAHLRRLGIRDRFLCLECGGTGAAPKPAPDLYVRACRSLGVSPQEALAVEDSPPGIAAAVMAGLRCVAVPGPLTVGLDLSRANLVLSSLEAASIQDVVRRV